MPKSFMIIGAGPGIGQAVAERFGQEGWTVIVSGAPNFRRSVPDSNLDRTKLPFAGHPRAPAGFLPIRLVGAMIVRGEEAARMKQLDFFYFFGSGYAYLSVMRIEAMAQKSGVAVRWRPFNVRTVMAENNIALRTQTAKVKYMWRDVERRAATNGVPYLRAPIWPTDPELLANRVAMVAAEGGWCEAYTVASFKAWYLEGMALGDRAHLEHVLPPLGQDVDDVIAKANEPKAHERFKAETDAARSYGIFGSPAFVADGETFWGDDRLEEALTWAMGQHRLQTPGQMRARLTP